MLLLSGCASTQGAAYGDAPKPLHETLVQDDQYVALVEQIAKQRGTRVVWVNTPRKRVPQAVADAR
ncbi:hypothetical protein DT603_13880 [Pseudoxanthomonas gei]|uniref:Uncharacterized protein n=1 Tax=Pseudoxanthomonas gei TaxID=1383030 RepID=A0ABX0AEA0_9GAMM|nr:hypothetical protein [Pseudoxanthomonas gei]